MSIVPTAQIIGGKFCAALSRKLVRDLFDVREIINDIPLTDAIKEGFFYTLLSHNNRIVDYFFTAIEHRENPTRSEIQGLIKTPLTKQEFQKTFQNLLNQTLEWLTPDDKTFLLEFQKGNDQFRNYAWLQFPSIKRKLENLRIFKAEKPIEFQKQVEYLEQVLYHPFNRKKTLLSVLEESQTAQKSNSNAKKKSRNELDVSQGPSI